MKEDRRDLGERLVDWLIEDFKKNKAFYWFITYLALFIYFFVQLLKIIEDDFSLYFIVAIVILSQVAYHYYIKAERIESRDNTIIKYKERIEELERELRNKK